MLTDRASNKKLNELRKQERSDLAKLARANAKLNRVPEAAEERTARVGTDVRENGQGTKCRTAEIGSSNRSRRRTNANGSPEVKSPTRKKGRKSVCKLCCLMT